MHNSQLEPKFISREKFHRKIPKQAFKAKILAQEQSKKERRENAEKLIFL